ncbi:hypothetical protein KGO06_02215 [Patescibacteria group bacterium]|nr:hypothetical protein [Patescibacteria group bacterium]
MAAEQQKSKAAQDFIPVEEVRGGVIVLKDGTLVSVLMASSLNFALKSAEEQEATLFQFQSFLNSLDFTIQLFVQSRKLDIRPYLTLLEERLVAQTDDLMRLQVRGYIDFIREFTDRQNIMSKHFFIVIPYREPLTRTSETVQRTFFGAGSLSAKEKSIGFEEQRTQLEQRVGVVEQGLTRCGIRTTPLDTESVIELLFKEFNPGELEKPISATAQSDVRIST